MKLSVSNIAWGEESDKKVYQYLTENGFSGLEIAPTRWIAENPYVHIKRAEEIAENIYLGYNLKVCSMQSIWFGRTENLFNSESERDLLLDYTKQAIDFAQAVKCPNLVFGSPKNRNNNANKPIEDVYGFFESIAAYADEKQSIIAIEPNPEIYGTNFINTTQQAFDFVKVFNSHGLRVNVDLGTMIQNEEDLAVMLKHIDRVSHIHISEPFLNPIKNRTIHKQLADELRKTGYGNYVSIEMKNPGSLDEVYSGIQYIRDLFL
jgi:sugar phosphate isomerase/epimerase